MSFPRRAAFISLAGLALGFLPEPFNYLCVPFGFYLGLLPIGYLVNFLLNQDTADSSKVSR